MYGYKDYFDAESKDEAYKNAAEERADYRALLDLMLEDLAFLKGIGFEDGLFSKGLVVTEQELKNHFMTPPVARVTDGFYYDMADAVEEAFAHIEARTKKTSAKVFLPIHELTEKYGLTKQSTVLLVLSILAVDSRSYERVFGFLQDDITCPDPTLGLATTLIRRSFRDPEIDTESLFGSLFASDGRDVHYPLRSVLTLSRAARSYIFGTRETYDGLLLTERKDTAPKVFDAYVKGFKEVLKEADGAALYLTGSDQSVASMVFSSVAGADGAELSLKRLLSLDEADALTLSDDLAFFRRGRNASVLLLDVTEETVRDERAIRLIERLLSVSGEGCILLSGGEKVPHAAGTLIENMLTIKLPVPDAAMRSSLWSFYMKQAKLAAEKDFDIDSISDCYEIGPFAIAAAVRQAKILLAEEGRKKLDKETAILALKAAGTADFSGLAKEVRTVYSWDDIHMGDGERKILQTAASRYKMRNRIGEGWGITAKNAYGNGVSVLLYGPPGTGKTMAAQVVAREVGLPLYRVDTSQLFSKYIGETQKNLNTVFDRAEKTNCILFFDEADALFSKRTDVESSNDRHANQEIAFLLQRIEEYRGMSILATNFYSGFDKAFVRRITYAVRMEQPDAAMRLKLWTSVLPQTVPMEKTIDFSFFAEQFELTGSNIKAIMLSAAYMAGAEGGKLSAKHIVIAMKYEFDKLGMMPDSGKFGPYAQFLYD